MLKFGSKSDVTVVHRATIRLLNDAEIIHCDFQLPKIQKESESSEDEEEEEDEEDLPACSLESKEEESVRTDTQNNSQTSEACLPPPQQKLKRKRHSEEESKLEEAYKLLKSNVEKDEYAVFGELLATKLRKLDEKLRLFVMHRINNILFEAEMQNCSNPQDKGRYILEYVCKQLDIMETDYFGLRYVDHCRQRHWLDLGKTAIKQIKDMDPILFSFRVKFYPPDPLRLKEEVTKNHVYQQLKRDLLHARLYCSPGEAALLAACIVQRELGDYDPKIHEGNYISEHKLLLKQTKTIEEKAMELHQTQLKGFTPEEAETHFLRLASKLDTYAVDPHPVKDHKGTQLYLGINHCGILTFQGWRKTHHFRWSEVQKINYEGKMFIVHLTISEDVRTKKKHTVGFKCPTGSNCRHVWRCAMEQMLFFTLPRASDAPVVSGGSIFSWGTKFKYTGRTEREVLEQSGPLRKEDQQAEGCQTTCLRRKASSVPATPSTPSQDLVEIRYSSLPRSCHSAGLEGTGMSEGGAGLPFSSPYCPDNTLPLLETVSEDQEIYARRNNAVDEKDSHASATHNTTTTTTTTTSTTTTTTTTTSNTTTNRAKVKLKFPKSTPNRPRPLYSQKIVIDSKELAGRRDIDNVVRQRMNALGKSPNIVRSTALIIKSSRSPMSSSYASKEIANGTFVLPTDSGTLITTVVDGPSYDPATGKAIPRKYNEKVSWLARTSNENLLIDTLKNSINGYVPPAKAQTTSVKNGLKPQDRTVGQHEDEANDYYFRDSFDHSSSESQLLDAPGKPHSRSVTPVPKMQKLQNSKLCLQQQHSHHHHRHPQAQHTSRRFDGKFRQKSVRIIRLFIPAFMLTIVVLFIVIVLVFETDTTLFNSLRKTPEMVALRNQYYVPIKEFLRTKLGLF